MLGMEPTIPTEKKTNVAYSYIRFSSPAQMKGDSLRRQTEASEAYAAEHGLILNYSLHLQDLGISAYHGKHATEGKLAAFLTAIQTGYVPAGSTLLVESLDRLSREQITEALTQFLQIINAGVVVVTLIDKMIYSRATINENPGSLMMSIVFMMRAHEESATKSKRIGAAWKKKRQMALETKAPRGKNCPNWLKLVTGEDGKKLYVVIPERAELLVRMFELAASGLGKRSIANVLNAEKIKPWRVGEEWAESSLHFLLKWPAAMGIYQPCRLDPETRRRIPEGPPIDGYFPQVISNELWQRAQCRTQAPRGPRRPSTHNLFTGLVIDGHNGFKMHYNEKTAAGKTRVYLCTARLRPIGIKSQMWPYDQFERTVLKHLRDLDWSSLVNKGPDQETAKLITQIADAELHIGKLDAEINKFLDALAEMPEILRKSAMARATTMAEEMEEVQARAEELRRQRDQLTAARNHMTEGIEGFKSLIEAGDPQSRLALQSEVRRRIKEISIRTEKTRQGKIAKIAIYFVNGAATWVITSPIVRGSIPSKAVEFEAPGKGRHTLDEAPDMERDPDEDGVDQATLAPEVGIPSST
ncbi:MAG: recombinase family protein [Terrimicrobiaceae bacterium]|nr:recombinase family protein [Terrimicrobiaceae bacterium]